MAQMTTVEEALNVVRGDGEALKDVPEEFKTEELCLEAVRKDGLALQFVPWGQLNLTVSEKVELCLEAVKQDSFALKNMPWRQLNLAVSEKVEICIEAVKQNGYSLQFVPKGLMTAEVCLEAVKHGGKALQFVPEKTRTAEICIEAVKREDNASMYVPGKLREKVRSKFNNMTKIDIRALTGEEIRFAFYELAERELNSVPPNTTKSKISAESDFVTDTIIVFITIPNHREVPKSITVKFTNIGNSTEHREAVINYREHYSNADLGSIVIMHASAGIANKLDANKLAMRTGQSYRQKAEITLNFENRSETLICPISRTTTFNMCFFEAYEAQNGKIDSVGSVNEFSN